LAAKIQLLIDIEGVGGRIFGFQTV